MARIKAVIFDFNGTLFLDTDFHNQAWMEFAVKYNCSLTMGDMEKHVHGFTNKEILGFLFSDGLSLEEIQHYSEEKETLYRSFCLNGSDKCILTKGAREFLDELKRRGLPRTIATASVKSNVDFFISTFQLGTWFRTEDIVYDSGEHRGKPYPDMFLAASRKINVPIGNCMIIEDSPAGIKAAKNAGAGHIVAFDPLPSSPKFADFNFIDQQISDFRNILLPL